MVRRGIPEFRHYIVSKATDSGPLPQDIVDVVKKTRRKVNRYKRTFKSWTRKGVANKRVKATYVIGPFELPVDFFVSCRWSELRNSLPLAFDRDSWYFAWRYWRKSRSYLGIKANIEKHGMRRPIFAELFVNYPPGMCEHSCLALLMENPRWPFLILRTGNERLMMAWFEWGWKTITTNIWIQDCGYSKEFSAILRKFFVIHKSALKGSLDIERKIGDKGLCSANR